MMDDDEADRMELQEAYCRAVFVEYALLVERGVPVPNDLIPSEVMLFLGLRSVCGRCHGLVHGDGFSVDAIVSTVRAMVEDAELLERLHYLDHDGSEEAEQKYRDLAERINLDREEDRGSSWFLINTVTEMMIVLRAADRMTDTTDLRYSHPWCTVLKEARYALQGLVARIQEHNETLDVPEERESILLSSRFHGIEEKILRWWEGQK